MLQMLGQQSLPSFETGCWQNVDHPFWTPFWNRKFFWRKKNIPVHVNTCINAVQTPMRLFRQETQANAPRCEDEHWQTHSPMALHLCTFIFFWMHLCFFTAHSLQMQARTSLHFFRMYLTFSKNRSLLLAEQEVSEKFAEADDYLVNIIEVKINYM